MNKLFETLTAGKSDDELVRMSHVHRPWMAKQIASLLDVEQALEIGCWKGETTVWLAPVFARVTVVDTFSGSPEHKQTHNLRESFDKNTAGWKHRIRVCEGESKFILPRLIAEAQEYDFIYVDGSHDSRDVIIDATLGFHLLRRGGIMIFDDYLWEMDEPFRTPRPAIDFFIDAYEKNITVHRYGAQVAVQKK